MPMTRLLTTSLLTYEALGETIGHRHIITYYMPMGETLKQLYHVMANTISPETVKIRARELLTEGSRGGFKIGVSLENWHSREGA